MKLGPPSGGGSSEDRKDGVVVQFPRTRSPARTASPTALFSNRQSTTNDAERYFSEFVEYQRRAHQTLDRVDADRAAKAFGRFIYASNRLPDGGLE